MNIIGFTGYKRSGKNTLANLVREAAEADGQSVQVVAYADKLKIAGARALGFDRPEQELIDLMDQFKEDATIRIEYTEEGAKKGTLHELTGREYLQFLGTEAGRQTFWDSFWIDMVTPPTYDELKERYHGVDLLLVTDVRFDNEAKRIHDLSGLLVEIQREGFSGDGHVSEAGISEELIDVTVLNVGSIDDLRGTAEYLVEAFA
jgi:hypothetical protein